MKRNEQVGYVFFRHRRLRGDMIEVFKMIHGIDKVNLGRYFCVDEDNK